MKITDITNTVLIAILAVFVYSSMTDSNWYEFRYNILGENPKSIAENVESTVAINSTYEAEPVGEDGKVVARPTGFGTGVVINSRQVLTSAHVVKNQAKDVPIKVQVLDRIVEANISQVFEDEDLAVIDLNETVTVPPVSFSCTPLQYTSEFVYTIGTPMAFEKSVRFGNVSRLAGTTIGKAWEDASKVDEEEHQDWLKERNSQNFNDMIAWPGNSGGALFNKRNNVIGVVKQIVGVPDLARKSIDNSGYTMTVKPEVICDVLDRGMYKYSKVN